MCVFICFYHAAPHVESVANCTTTQSKRGNAQAHQAKANKSCTSYYHEPAKAGSKHCNPDGGNPPTAVKK